MQIPAHTVNSYVTTVLYVGLGLPLSKVLNHILTVSGTIKHNGTAFA